jgi:glycosyltransferase involved in cell wall biosynthesis
VPPKISVLMSVYNGARYLRQALDSILHQSFTDFECLLIDDGSSDQSAEIVAGYADARIHYISDGQNIGLTRRLNEGIEIARGKYIARHDDDDISTAQRFARQVEFLEANQDHLACGSRVAIIDPDGDVIGSKHFALDHSELMDQNLSENQFIHGSLMVRKEALLKVGGYRLFFVYAQDYDLTLRLQEQGKVANLAGPLYALRYSNETISAARAGEQMAYAAHARMAAEKRRMGESDPIESSEVVAPGSVTPPESGNATERLLYLYLRSGHRLKARQCIDQLLAYNERTGLKFRRLLTYLPGPLMSTLVKLYDGVRA